MLNKEIYKMIIIIKIHNKSNVKIKKNNNNKK